MSEVLVVQHVSCETLGTIAVALEAEGLSTQWVRPFQGNPVPKELGDAAALIVMGGPVGVYEQDRYPFLRDEIRLIEQALKEEKPVLGICLGSQLLAAVLGGEVTKGKKKEIGWYRVTLTESGKTDPLWKEVESSFTAYHWHGDIFNLPKGAAPLASSDLTACQAFCYGDHAYGFLFHMEVTRKIIEEMVDTFADELQEAGVDGQGIVGKIKDHLPELQKIGSLVFRRWARLVERSA